jgi:hypothetical protein
MDAKNEVRTVSVSGESEQTGDWVSVSGSVDGFSWVRM